MNPISLKLKAEPLILLALQEDITNEDISTGSILECAKGSATVQLLAKQDGVICGLDVFERVFQLLDKDAYFRSRVSEGDEVKKGQLLGEMNASLAALLSGERVALNYLQRMSGIASYTRRIATVLAGSSTRLADTRKTTPNMRIFEKEAARVGGAVNHRFNLSDAVMLKDNHIAAAGGIKKAVRAARAHTSFVYKIEVEVETLEQVDEALAAEADIIMLDNMSRDLMLEAIARIDHKALIEVSGNVDFDKVKDLVDLGVDIISCGALTHSAPILDLSLKNLRLSAEPSSFSEDLS